MKGFNFTFDLLKEDLRSPIIAFKTPLNIYSSSRMHFLYHWKRLFINHQPPSLPKSLWGRPYLQFNPFWPCRYYNIHPTPTQELNTFSWEITHKGKCSIGVQKHASKWSWIINSSRDEYACIRSLLVVKKNYRCFFYIYMQISWVFLYSGLIAVCY